MKIGIISDIHADLQALEAALKLLKQHGAQSIVCAGDLVERGFAGDAVVRLMQERKIPTVGGNHDRDAIFNQMWMQQNMESNNPEVQKRLLQTETLDFLRGLPQILRTTFQGIRLLVAHGTPTKKDEYLFSRSPKARFKVLAAEARADVIILGHTHEPMKTRVRGVWFLNPGSVYGGEERGSHTCGLLTLPECHFEVLHIATQSVVDVSSLRF